MANRHLQHCVQHALESEPSLDATEITVAVDDGVVTLCGDVMSTREKRVAERVVLGVNGVQAVANNLGVRPLRTRVRAVSKEARKDSDIAQAALTALKLNSVVPPGRIGVTVSEGRLVLTGDVDWQFQKEAAGRTVLDVADVVSVTNSLAVKPPIEARDIKGRIEAAFRRRTDIDAKRIRVEVHDGTVTLTGTARSWTERHQAERTAWAALGVTHVEDRVQILP